MSRPGFLNKVPGQGIFRGQQIYLLSWLYFVRCLLLPFFARIWGEGELFHGPALGDPLEKSETDSKGGPFLEITMFLGRKIDKIGTD